MKAKVFSAAGLVFGSGFCALIYQTTWLREFRLIFGNSTAASAAVVGIFMGGLGIGSALLGKRAEKSERPLAFYAQLEFFIAVGAALTPTLVSLVRALYIATGGALAMGNFFATCVRLLLAAVVLAAPTLLMGGTLPAMARFAVSDGDTSRRGLALLYGTNTLGAVAGALAGTFFLLERFGNHRTLYYACALNATIAALAWFSARRQSPISTLADAEPSTGSREAVAPFGFVLGAAAVTGFAFLLMELIWYRMLSPILGGTAFTFGLILAIALLGIGTGGVLYSFFTTDRRPTLNAFAFTCALEALFLAIPFALGDRIALSAMLLKPLAALGFAGRVAGWTGICAVIVFPAAFIAGIQFPMLLGLLGTGRKEIGLQTGTIYAWNTAGAIAGSLLGGFGLIPLLAATGAWKLDIAILIACAFAAAILGQRRSPTPWKSVPAILINTAVIFILIFAAGPTVAWRHGQIERMKKYTASPNEMRDLLHHLRRDILWQADGIESSIGISKTNSLAFIVNGKCDGNSTSDAGTQVMCGLLAGLTHPNPKQAAVIGLGTGSTAGWLAALPSMQQVDVIELEPVIAKFAALCAPVNHDALNNPKLHLIFGDGRELLQTNNKKYDLIVSEPSNPYRAGVASLFTRDYYETLARKLNPGGLFAQWLQAYEVDLRTIRIFYATFGSVFPHIETWQTQNGDLLLVGSKDPIRYDLDALRARIATEPFRTALPNVWQTTDLEGVFAHYVGNGKFARNMIQSTVVPLNTDDRMLLEFAFARNRQIEMSVSFSELRRDAAAAEANRPDALGHLDWKRVEDQRIGMLVSYDGPMKPEPGMTNEQARLLRTFDSYVANDFKGAREHWKAVGREPRNLRELMLVAESLADLGDESAAAYLDALRQTLPNVAEALRARLFGKQTRIEEARTALRNFVQALHADPWPNSDLVTRTLNSATDLLDRDNSSEEAIAIFHALETPFAVYSNNESREKALLRASMAIDGGKFGANVLRNVEALEPDVPWDLGFLRTRASCYRALKHPRAADADADVVDYLEAESGGLESIRTSRIARAGK